MSQKGHKQKLSLVTNVRAMLELAGQANVKLWPRPARQSLRSGRDQQLLHGCVITCVINGRIP